MLEKLRPLLTLGTSLGDVPEYWRRMIEPRIERSKDHDCWMWLGAHDKDGEPVINFVNPETGTRNTRRLKRIVIEMFYKLKRTQDVVHNCGNLSCLNPTHLVPARNHWSQR